VKNILIDATQSQRFLDQLNFARNIARTTDELKIHFFIGEKVYSLYGNVVDKLEFKVVNELKKQADCEHQNSIKIAIKEKIKNITTAEQRQWLRKYINSLKNTKLFTNKLKKQEKKFLEDLEKNYERILKLVQNYKIDVLLINGDRHLGLEPVFLKISKKLNIPSIIIYQVFFADKELILRDISSMNKKINDFFFVSKYIVSSQKTLQYKVEKEIYYYPHPIANALDKFGVLTKNPYVMGSGCSDILCLNNQYYKDLYVGRGVDEKKIRVVGDGSYDLIYIQYSKKEEVRQKISKKYSSNSNKKLVIIALPQLGEHNILSWKEHWEEINFLMNSLSKLNQNILISLHPKMDKNKYKFLEDKCNCTILDERLADVLPIADMFVATFSSTVVWSVLCGIKTVVVDFYGLNYTMYDFLTSIKKVDKKENLKATLETTLSEDIDFSKDWKSLSRDEVFDGQTIQRYIKLINEATK
jgi:hypothetical protein